MGHLGFQRVLSATVQPLTVLYVCSLYAVAENAEQQAASCFRPKSRQNARL